MTHNWDDYPNLQEVLDVIHGEIQAHNTSEVWRGSIKVYETVQSHLERLYKYVPVGLNKHPSAEICVKFIPSIAHTMLKGVKEMESRVPGSSIHWEDYSSTVLAMKDIVVEVLNKGVTEPWTGGWPRFTALNKLLSVYNIQGRVTAEGDEFIAAVFEHKPLTDVEQHWLNQFRNLPPLSKTWVSSAMRIGKATEAFTSAAARLKAHGIPSVPAVKQSPIWIRRNQPTFDVRLVSSIDIVVEDEFNVVLRDDLVVPIKCVSHAAALEARRSLINLLVYINNQI